MGINPIRRAIPKTEAVPSMAAVIKNRDRAMKAANTDINPPSRLKKTAGTRAIEGSKTLIAHFFFPRFFLLH